jgi:hypothetical protein
VLEEATSDGGMMAMVPRVVRLMEKSTPGIREMRITPPSPSGGGVDTPCQCP